jgi:hypothetical protein
MKDLVDKDLETAKLRFAEVSSGLNSTQTAEILHCNSFIISPEKFFFKNIWL